MIYSIIYSQTITILNKLRCEDNNTHRDIWYKTVLHNAAVYKNAVMSASGTSANINTYKIILIPFSDNYEEYIKWKSDESRGSKYTVSSGDYVIKGEVTETIDADNIVSTLQHYGENVCLVRHFSELYQRFGAHDQLKIEGV